MKCLDGSNRWAFAALGGVSLFWNVTAAEFGAKDFKPANLYQITNIWSAHFTLTPEQWGAMEPAGGAGGFFGMFGGEGGFRMPEGFGTGMFLAPGFFKAGDQDRDGKLTEKEFLALGETWFSDWDTNRAGRLTSDQVRTGLNAALGQGNFGMPGMIGPGAPGFLQGTDGQRNGLSSMMGLEFKYVPADLEFQNKRFTNIAVRYKGNGTFMESRGSLKRSLKADLNQFVKGQKLAGLSTLNFHNNVTDAGFMNEVLAFRLFRDAGVPAPRTAYTRVFVTVPGKHERRYFGLYSIVENVDNNFFDERFGSKKGAILKPCTPSPFTDLGDDWKSYNQSYDPKTELTLAQAQRIIDFCKLVSKADDAEFEAKLGGFVELEEFAKFMAITVYLSSMDSILGVGQNYYVFLHPKTQRLHFIPWDQDHSFGDFLRGGAEPGNLSIHRPWWGENRFLERVFKVEAFKKQYLAKLEEFSRTIFQPERFHRQMDELASAIRPAVREESEQKLARFNRVVAGESPGFAFGFGGLGGLVMKPMKTFIQPRAQSVLDQLAGKSEGQSPAPFQFGGGAGFGGGGPGGPGGFGPGMFLATPFVNALDSNKDSALSRDELVQGFAEWFKAWNTNPSGALTEEQVRAGMNKTLPLFPGGAAPGFRAPTPER